MTDNQEPVSPFAIVAADGLAAAVNQLIKRGILNARSPVGDALLDYASIRFGDRNPIGDLENHVNNQKLAQSPQQR